jgi:DNA-binding CsgD family transcriptional regulator
MHINDHQMIGLAGQYLACCDLITKGLVAYPVAEGLPYDLVIDGIHTILKVQVKTCWRPVSGKKESVTNKNYTFNFQHGRGKYAVGRYSEDEADIFALVALDIRKVGYVKVKDTGIALRFRSDIHKGDHQSDKVMKQHEDIMAFTSEGIPIPEICKRMGISDSTVHNHLKSDFKVADSSHRYFSAIERNADWFWEIINVKK